MRSHDVLIIDDEYSSLEIIKAATLTVDGCKPVTANTFEEAEKLLSIKKFDIVVCDCILEAKRNGGEQLYHLTVSSTTNANLPMPYWIFVSGDDDMLRQLVELPFSTFVSKPFTVHNFRTVIQTATDALRFASIDKELFQMKGSISILDESLKEVKNGQDESLKILRKIKISKSVEELTPGVVLEEIENFFQTLSKYIKCFMGTIFGKLTIALFMFFIYGILSKTLLKNISSLDLGFTKITFEQKK